MKLTLKDALSLIVLMSLVFLFINIVFADRKEDRSACSYIFQVDVNKADKSELRLIPGIGPALADKIIDKRQELGGFDHLEDLMLVHGIGEKIFQKIKPFLKIENSKTKGRSAALLTEMNFAG